MAEVNEVPIGHAPIDGRVLAHRRDDDAVGQLLAADPKRREQRAHAPPRAVRRSARIPAALHAMGFLLRGEALPREMGFAWGFGKDDVARGRALRAPTAVMRKKFSLLC